VSFIGNNFSAKIKTLFRLSVVVFYFFFTPNTGAQEAYFLSDPSLSHDADTVIYAYDGDSWKVASNGALQSVYWL